MSDVNNHFLSKSVTEMNHHSFLKQSVEPCFSMVADGSSLSISYLPDTNQIQYIANVTQNSFLAVGYGTTMIDTDMVAWIADGSSSFQQNLYSTGETDPTVLTQNTYTTSIND